MLWWKSIYLWNSDRITVLIGIFPAKNSRQNREILSNQYSLSFIIATIQTGH